MSQAASIPIFDEIFRTKAFAKKRASPTATPEPAPELQPIIREARTLSTQALALFSTARIPGDAPFIERIIAENPKACEETDENGMRPLEAAMLHGQAFSALILARHTRLDRLPPCMDTFLHLASNCRRGHDEIQAMLLLPHALDFINTPSEFGHTPLMRAAIERNHAVFQCLIEHSDLSRADDFGRHVDYYASNSLDAYRQRNESSSLSAMVESAIIRAQISKPHAELNDSDFKTPNRVHARRL